MRKLDIPIYDACLSLETCISHLRDAGLRTKLTAIKPAVIAAETNYKNCGSNGTFFRIAEATTVAGCVTVQEMEKLYKGTFSRKKSRARQIYDEIKTASSICPLCAQRDVSTLDHYLAQSRHPALTVTPANLVPACLACNKAKLDRQPQNAEEQTLHPYFDEVDDEMWLFARVLEDSPPIVRFTANPPTNWPIIKQERVKTHFRIFGLATLYSTHAASELVGIYLNLTRIASHGGPDDLRHHLAEQQESREAVTRNSWQGAMYKALSESDWFCTEGYKAIRA
ncbi:MAG: hypothetical protein GXY80_00625 [Syntrophorhabdus aromaticivorans]|jgi:hypothetical protein|uniref:HNH endonuclease n=1 Tax=Syntrophorhabdus aromaticivorans TaxID=328301 RepID=A0A971M147_9BACT|nr:hypothetical protein [Syntrophorhabdus aromaticivorans]